MPDEDGRFLPIIYVRGYAMTEQEQDETTADPFCGFNLGSTVFRATPDKTKPAKKFIFESPVLRLTSDYDYSDVYHNGLDIMDPDWERNIPAPPTPAPSTPAPPVPAQSLPARSIIIYRYYEQASSLLGEGKTPPMEEFAKGLNQLVLRLRDLVCADPNNKVAPADFRCYLVAHSMGGLVCRAFLQNPALGDEAARRCIDKVFTYATPHNGIEMAGLNVPKWLTKDDIANFNRDRMAEYLNIDKNLYQQTERADWLPEEMFRSRNFFCMVGTNREDYEAAKGISRTFAGHGSDGLVRIDNASVWGVNAKGEFSAPCATAYAYRSHSGYFGIVNSEEAYQNLTRFLFGDLRVDVWVDVTDVQLPAQIKGKAVDALYQFGLLASPKGKRWFLSRRVAEEDSVACRSHQELTDPANPTRRSLYLSSIFLSTHARLDPKDPSLNYGLTLSVRVPDYEVERKFWPDSHFEGAYLFRDTLIVSITAPQTEGAAWAAASRWQSDNSAGPGEPLKPEPKDGHIELTIGFGDTAREPGIAGKLRFLVSSWND